MNSLPICFFCFITLIACSSIMKGATAQQLLDALYKKMTSAKTYTSEMNIKVDVAFLKAPEAKAKIWFKAPDKTHIEAPGFAMIPKQGADLSASTLLSKPYASVDAGTEMFQGVQMRKIKVLPADESLDIAVATIYVDTTLMIPRKVVTTSRKGGTVVAELVYTDLQAREFCLPSYVKLMMEIGAFELPKTMTGDFDAPKKDPKKSKDGKTTATVEIWYVNYKLNVPISDAIFKQ